MKNQPKSPTYKKQKIDTYVSLKDINRLGLICKEYGFSSTYQLLKYLVDCFLRVADPANDDNNNPVPHAIEEMFISPREYRRIKRIVKNNKNSKKLEIQLLIPFGEYVSKRTRKVIINEQGLKMADEIKDMFETNSDWRSSEGMTVYQKPDQRKIKTPDDLK
ncbi:hypothetical protein [Dysgonomonas sp. GY617]|uniref:hypothetical protein n=1 Tax=Dysgonomonas sp. GY617 TaxID=2780420 RepID=UPI0018848E34|nr:hypothetical protein [Dysgonomonas sp. GY617]MBF0577719.1 hypothetical protein [Dysgonomonas sp. GY617]